MRKVKDLIGIFILGGILVALVIFLFITAYNLKIDENKNINRDDEIVEESNIDKDKEEDSKEEIGKPQENNKPEETSKPQENNNEIESFNKEEQDVIEYISCFNNDLDKYDEKDKTFLEKTKGAFITIVDFLFYGGKIKGYTFKDLSFESKVKVLKLVAEIDNKIDTKFPGYKDSIKEKTNNLKGKIAYLYLETTNKFCDKVSQEVCNTARDDFNNMKEKYSYTWETVKEVILNAGGKITTMLSEWYKSIK